MAEIERGDGWQFVSGEGDTLCVFFSALQRATRFSHFRTSVALTGPRLLFHDREEDVFASWLNDVLAVVDWKIQETGARRVVLWGQSAGSYPALVCGLTLRGIETRTVAIAPYLRLNAPLRREIDPSRAVLPQWLDLRPALREHRGGAIDLVLPCNDLRTWPDLADAQSLVSPHISLFPLAADHDVQRELVRRNELDSVLADIQAFRSPRFEPALLATTTDIELAGIGWEMYRSLEAGDNREFSWPSDVKSRNNWWFEVKSRYLRQHGQADAAILPLLRAVSLNPSVDAHYIGLAHYFAEHKVDQLAAICYALGWAKGARDGWLKRKLDKFLDQFASAPFAATIAGLMQQDMASSR